MNRAEDLLTRIDAYCARTRTSATAFGRGAVNDPRLVGELRKGRSVTLRTLARIEAFMAGTAAAGHRRVPSPGVAVLEGRTGQSARKRRRLSSAKRKVA